MHAVSHQYHIIYSCFTVIALLWRHNGRGSVSNHQPRDCLLNRLFGRRSKKTSKLRVTGLCAWNSSGPVNSPHKGPVRRKMFPFDDVIMGTNHRITPFPVNWPSAIWWVDSASTTTKHNQSLIMSIWIISVVPKPGIKDRDKWLHPTVCVGCNN